MTTTIKQNSGSILYTLFTLLLLFAIIISIASYIYDNAEEESFYELHLETKQLKDSISLQMISDRENLITMAGFASKLYLDGEDFDLLFNSFQKIGLIESIGILMPDNTMRTRMGIIDASEFLDFSEESQKRPYISGRVNDLTKQGREIIRSSVPIIADNEIIGVLYGVVGLDFLKSKYLDSVKELNAELYVIEAGTGDFVIDTKRKVPGNITSLASAKFADGFSYSKMIEDISSGIDGYTSYVSKTSGKYTYSHYAPLGISDWQIMLSKPESEIFAVANETGKLLITMFVSVLVIMAFYIVFIIMAAKRKSNVNFFASKIRKRLLELNQNESSLLEALNSVMEFSKSRSAFFVDTVGGRYNIVAHTQSNDVLVGADRSYFLGKLMEYIIHRGFDRTDTVSTVSIKANAKLKNEMPELFDFMSAHKIKAAHFAGVHDAIGNLCILGVVNPKKSLTAMLLKDISICFSMAVYNKKHLDRTENMAFTDSLTGLGNRMAYKEEIKLLSSSTPRTLACVYIDVNGLHSYNNKYGHAAGDQMLVSVADELKSEFPESKIFRMGGDEFLVFTENITSVVINKRIATVKANLEEMKYHIATGVRFINEDIGLDELIFLAEKEMYDEKMQYYQLSSKRE